MALTARGTLGGPVIMIISFIASHRSDRPKVVCEHQFVKFSRNFVAPVIITSDVGYWLFGNLALL